MSGIKDPVLFRSVYEAASWRLKLGNAATLFLPFNEGLVRSVPSDRLKDDRNRFDLTKVAGCIAPRDTGLDQNRFSGLGPDGTMLAKQGGLYTSKSTASMGNEVMWYFKGNKTLKQPFGNYEKAMGEKGVLMMRVTKPLLLVDLSRYYGQFLKDLGQDNDVKAALRASRHRDTSLERALNDSEDYSIGRAIGLAVANSPLVDGLQAGTARLSDRAGETGDNVVLYGPTGIPISSIKVEKVVLFDYDPRKDTITPQVHEP